MSNDRFIWAGLTLWNLLMAITFLVIGITLTVKTRAFLLPFLIMLIALAKCFIFGLCLDSYLCELRGIYQRGDCLENGR